MGCYAHGASQSILRRRIDEVEGLLEIVVIIHIDSQYRTEDLLSHGDGMRVGRQNDGRLHEVTLRVVA